MLSPQFDNSTAICMASDNNYAQYLAVTIQSIVDNSSNKSCYELYILETDIEEHIKSKIIEIAKGKNNFLIIFININSLVSQYSLDNLFLTGHFASATYYRLLIPEIFKKFSKLLYIDCDLIVTSDINELYNINIQNNSFAAALDVGIQFLYKTDKAMQCYLDNTLKLYNINNYFNNGVILFNIQKINGKNLGLKLFEKLEEIKNPLSADQDIFNKVFENDIHFFDLSWNYMWHIDFITNNIDEYISLENYNNFLNAKSNPKIIHYTSGWKPWNEPQRDLSYLWWNYARKSPFYEEILYSAISRLANIKSISSYKNSAEKKDIKQYYFSQVFPFLRIVQQNNIKKFIIWRLIPIRKLVFSSNKVDKYFFNIKYKTVKTGQDITSNDNYVKNYSLAHVFPFLRIVEENNTRKFMLWRFIPIRKVVFDGNKVHKYLFGIKYKTIKS